MIPKYLNNLTEELYQSTTYLPNLKNYLSDRFRQGRNIGLGIAFAAVLGLTGACEKSEIPTTPNINATVEARVQATVAAIPASPPISASTPTPPKTLALTPTSSQVDYPLAEWISADSSNYQTANRNRDNINQIVIHTTEATTLESTINWFKNPDSNVSSHYLIGPKGKIIQMVREEDISWHAREYNTSSIGIEHVGKTSNPNWATEEMYKASAELVRYLAEKYDISVDRTHIKGHDELYPKSDPGQFWNWDNYMSLVGHKTPAIAAPTDAPSPTDEQGKIAFSSNRDVFEIFEIYVMNLDGSGLERLTENSAFDGSPAWSPDGKKIAFNSDRDGNWEIYGMRADGSKQKNLTNNPAEDALPAWSPDGKKIAFSSDRDGNWEIYVMNLDGSGLESLTNNIFDDDQDPAWSPDGKKIAFSSDRDGNWEIYVMNVDGSELERLTNNIFDDDQYPAWSPDGKKIAFSSEDRAGKNEIYVMNVDGSGLESLTNDIFDDYRDPAWSPDGKKIAFSSDRDEMLDTFEIYVMNLDGGGLERLTENSAFDGSPAWSPFLSR